MTIPLLTCCCPHNKGFLSDTTLITNYQSTITLEFSCELCKNSASVVYCLQFFFYPGSPLKPYALPVMVFLRPEERECKVSFGRDEDRDEDRLRAQLRAELN